MVSPPSGRTRLPGSGDWLDARERVRSSRSEEPPCGGIELARDARARGHGRSVPRSPPPRRAGPGARVRRGRSRDRRPCRRTSVPARRCPAAPRARRPSARARLRSGGGSRRARPRRGTRSRRAAGRRRRRGRRTPARRRCRRDVSAAPLRARGRRAPLVEPALRQPSSSGARQPMTTSPTSSPMRWLFAELPVDGSRSMKRACCQSDASHDLLLVRGRGGPSRAARRTSPRARCPGSLPRTRCSTRSHGPGGCDAIQERSREPPPRRSWPRRSEAMRRRERAAPGSG